MRSSLATAGLFGGAAMLLGACGDSSAPGDLDSDLCSIDVVGPSYQELTRGEATRTDLAGFDGDWTAREQAFRQAGLERGRFAIFKSVLSKPPFEPPATVVCEVLQFGTQAEAAGWVESLAPVRVADLALVGAAPSGVKLAEESPVIEGEQGERRFVAVRYAEDPPFALAIGIVPDGAEVRVFAFGVEARFIDSPFDGWPQEWAGWVAGR